jgi:tetratricopeptide (TPR) repeat protein
MPRIRFVFLESRRGRNTPWFWIRLAVTLFVASLVPANAQVSSRNVNTDLLQDAAQSIAAGDLGRAEKDLQFILRISPQDYRALNFLGIVRAQQRREAEAEQLFRQVIQGKPDFASAHVNLGLLYVQMNRQEDAVPELQEALHLDPDRSEAADALAGLWRGQARAAVSSGDPEKALSLLIRARKVAPGNPDVQFDFGMVALRMSLLPDALEGFQEALKLRANDASAIYGLGRTYMNMARFEDAREQFASYLTLRPGDASAHYALGMALAALDQANEARGEFEKSTTIAPVQTESYCQLGRLDLDSKDLDSAGENFRRALDRDPKNLCALTGLGRVDFGKKNFTPAADFLQRAIAVDFSLREAHYYLGLTYARLGKREASDRELQIAARLEHEEVEKHRTSFRIEDPANLDGPVSPTQQ